MAAQELIWRNKKENTTTPILVLTNLDPEQVGMAGGMAAAGGLDHLGIPSLRACSRNLTKDERKLQQVVESARFAGN